jgi:DNA-binding MarR family transcriptional regulator
VSAERTANLLGAHALVVAERLRAAAGRELSSAAVLCALRTVAPGASIDELRRVLGLSHSGGVRIVGRLEREGLVARRVDPADRRALRVELTAAGRREADTILAARRAALGSLLGALDPGEQDVLTALLERGLAAATHGEDDARHICRLCEPRVCGHPDRCPVTQALL